MDPSEYLFWHESGRMVADRGVVSAGGGIKKMIGLLSIPGSVKRLPGRKTNATTNKGDEAMGTIEESRTRHNVASREEWISARKELLTKEKEATRLRDELSAQ